MSVTKPLTGLQKAALLLQHLGAQATDTVLARLSPALAQQLRTQLQQLKPDAETRAAFRDVLGELEQALAEIAAPPPPAPPPTRVDRVVRDEPAKEPEPATPAPGELPADPLLALRKIPAEHISSALSGENPRTVGLVLSALDDVRAAEVYKRLTSEQRREVSLRFASQGAAPLEVLRRIAQGVVQRSLALARSSLDDGPEARVKKMAALLRQVERTERLELITALSQKDATMAQRLKDELYQFEDITRLVNASVQKLLAELDTKNLAAALKGAAPDIVDKIRTNLSRRAQEGLQEELDLLGTIPAATVAQARRAVVEAMQRLDERGELLLAE
jgi:flagellar motor switch protein FliG